MAGENTAASFDLRPFEDAWRKGASGDVLRELLVGWKQETRNERQCARHLLQRAIWATQDEMVVDVTVIEVLLDAMSKEALLEDEGEVEFRSVNNYRFSALYAAIEISDPDVVMAVVERMRRPGEAFDLPFHYDLYSFLHIKRLVTDREVFDAVISLMPPAAFGAFSGQDDALHAALRCPKECRERVVELCLRRGPTMEERLKLNDRFTYVLEAARRMDVEMVKRMHDLVPLLPDGSGRRARREAYTIIVDGLGFKTRISLRKWAILQFFSEQSGIEILDPYDRSIVFELPTPEAVDWLVARMPHVLEVACERASGLSTMLESGQDMVLHLAELVAELVEPAVIVKAMQRVKGPDGDAWRWQLEALHKGVPESMDGLRWPWLMHAIRDKAYKDVEYMLGMCTREHLTKRNDEGDRAHDVAARDGRFPKWLLSRLQVAVKGAHA